MKIGKIKFKIENNGGKRYFFARPVSSQNMDFPARIGYAQVVYVEKNQISEDFLIGETYEVYALFHIGVSNEQFRNSICKTKITPISRESFNALKGEIENERDFNHAFIADY